MSTCWTPINHCYDGTCNGQRVDPHYNTMPDRIRVFDVAVRTQGWRRWQKRLWRKARTKGLERWGYPVEVVELREFDYPPEGITLGTFVPNPVYGANSYGGFGLAPITMPEQADFLQETWDEGKGFAMIHPTEISNAFAGRSVGRLAGAICHEVGHALGFGHGGTGVMRSVLLPPYYPSDEERTALVEYWGWV